MPYPTYFGGVTSFTKEQYLKCNGASNQFWGWGGEDDDLWYRYVCCYFWFLQMNVRVGLSNQSAHSLPRQLGRYTMINHTRDADNEINGIRYRLFDNSSRTWTSDGLNSLQFTLVRYY